MSFDQGQNMVKRLGKILKVRNGSKNETDLHIVNSCQSVVDRSDGLDNLFNMPSKEKDYKFRPLFKELRGPISR